LAALEPIVRKSAGLTSSQGAMVEEVPAGSVGARAGLRGSVRSATGLEVLGDVIVAVDGKGVQDRYDIVRLIAAKRPGQAVGLTIVRNKREAILKVLLQKRSAGG
jgi:serine protease Do